MVRISHLDVQESTTSLGKKHLRVNVGHSKNEWLALSANSKKDLGLNPRSDQGPFYMWPFHPPKKSSSLFSTGF